MKLRFAPAPSGSLHVGNARLAVANWLFARQHKGSLLLRFDDTDSARVKEAHVRAIEQDLKWLGLDWDETLRQSERAERYSRVIEALKASGRLYPCFESELELSIKRERRLKAGQPPLYDREMLSLTPEQRARAEANGKVPHWRFKLSGAVRRWDDMVLGPCQVKLTAVSDPILVRADGTILYTLASLVDDVETAVTHILRGEDHVTNTGVQLDIAAALGLPEGHFTFGHFPLLVDGEGHKLSKRAGALSLGTLRKDGLAPLAVVNYLAALGSSVDPQVLPEDALANQYDISRISRSPARFDMGQLLSLNRHLLRTLDYDAARAFLPEGAGEDFWLAVRGNVELESDVLHWHDVVSGAFLPPAMAGEKPFLEAAAALLPPEPWSGATWREWTEALKAESGRKGKALYHPLRLALTGEDSGPELAALLPLMGRARVLARLGEAGRS
ncbi:glutamate--tRNA ligase [Formicincola oecophyllae]|uniref:Glutamate--tRNA ligase n=1 Tax=Formicincola oecophyllae TaxID=2558361 RepID=A0A4Y6UAJ4_9PROT|nr:glutamate--tRNA ligase [Formicincola oecophyllae]QDH14442.1 glutamate--tRNA ligase [Formicincola oecophyllae]